METKNIILIGGGCHAKACIDVIRATGQFTIAGYTDINQSLQEFPEIPYLGNDDCLSQYIHEALFLITVGQIKNPSLRVKLFELLQQQDAAFSTVISPHAYVSPMAKVEPGTIVMHGAIVQAEAVIGRNCIINDRALIEHDCRIGDHCHISTAAVLNGNVILGNAVFVGSGAIVKNGTRIGDNAIVGMGAVVINEVGPGVTYIGNPAKIK